MTNDEKTSVFQHVDEVNVQFYLNQASKCLLDVGRIEIVTKDYDYMLRDRARFFLDPDVCIAFDELSLNYKISEFSRLLKQFIKNLKTCKHEIEGLKMTN